MLEVRGWELFQSSGYCSCSVHSSCPQEWLLAAPLPSFHAQHSWCHLCVALRGLARAVPWGLCVFHFLQ